MRQYRGVIFDMDGLIFDSERIIMEAWQEMGRQLGYEDFGKNIFQTWGMNREAREKYFLDKYGEEFPYEVFQEGYRQLVQRRIREQGLPTKRGLGELLDYLKGEGIPMAVGTSSSRLYTLQKLQEAGIDAYFSAVLCGDMVTHSKPHPEIYERACEALSIEPREALVLEDSRNGIRAALAAGASVIWIPDLVTELPQEEPYLTARFEHLGQVARWMARIRTAPAKI